jgi:hypothetical protein
MSLGEKKSDQISRSIKCTKSKKGTKEEEGKINLKLRKIKAKRRHKRSIF